MPRRGLVPPPPPPGEAEGGGEGDDTPAYPPHPWPNEQPLPPEVLADSRGAAYAAARALQERAREDAALCGSWPVTWARLQQLQGQDGNAAWLERDLDATVSHKKGRTLAGDVTRKHVELVRGHRQKRAW